MLWPFVILACCLTALVAWSLAHHRARSARRVRALAELGFTPCNSETEALGERVVRLANCSRYDHRVLAPQRATLEGRAVYWYFAEMRRQGETASSEQILLPLARRVPDALILYYKPSALARGARSALIAKIATGPWDTRADDLVPLDIPIDHQQGNLIAAMAPAGASLYDLIDRKTLALLEPVADHGALAVTCRGSDCSLTSSGTSASLDAAALWPIVRELVTT